MWRSVLVGIGFAVGVTRQDVPQTNLTMREVIETVAVFEIHHVNQQPFFQKAYGVTDFETDPPSIWLFNTGTNADKRSTVIHELLHIHYHEIHHDMPEEFIRSEEERLYLKWFSEEK